MADAHRRPGETIRTGRQQDNDTTRTSDVEVSRRQAESRANPEGRFEIIDLGSRTGTYANGERITRTMLTEQDVVRIGDATFRLSDGELRPYPGPEPPGV